MQGRKPKPVELAAAQGNPGRRPLPDVVLIEGRGTLAIPERLTGEAVKVWNEIVPALSDANLLDKVDAMALEGLCVLVARAREASRMIEEQGYTTPHPKTGVLSVSPWVRIERDAWTQAIKIAEHFGLTPVARTRLGLAVLKGRGLMKELEDTLG